MDKHLFVLFSKDLPMSKLTILEANNEEDFFIFMDILLCFE